MIANEKLREQINRLINAFGQTHFSSERLKAIGNVLFDLPHEAVIDITTTMIEQMRHAPLPKDFREAKNAWIQNRNSKTVDVSIPVDRCPDCFDTGYLFCKLPDDETQTLAFCHCEFGSSIMSHTDSLMPQWKPRVFDRAYGFTLFPFPAEKFRPQTPEEKAAVLSGGPVAAVSWWIGEKINAHRYWSRRVAEAKVAEL